MPDDAQMTMSASGWVATATSPSLPAVEAERRDLRAERRGLFVQPLGVRSGCKADDLQLVRMCADDVERALAD